MNKTIKTEFLKLLRSGDYNQTDGGLRSTDEEGNISYCASGLLCEMHRLATKSGKWVKEETIAGISFYDYVVRGKAGISGEMPLAVAKWAGLDAAPHGGLLKNVGVMQSLEEVSDSGLSFKRIALLVEKQW